MSARILMYHGLESPDFPSELTDPGDLVYVLDSELFERQLSWLGDHNWAIDNRVEAGPTAKQCLLTFDDGHVTNFHVALPILQQRSLRAHFFITSDWIGTQYFMDPSMLRALDAADMIIGSHGASHRFLTDMSLADARAELDTSKKRIEDILGKEITSVSAPGGRIDARVGATAAELGYTDVYTSDATAPFTLEGITVHGRLALKRGYSMQQFGRMIHAGRQPEWAVRTQGIALAKRVLGNKRYQRLRSAALKVLELRRG